MSDEPLSNMPKIKCPQCPMCGAVPPWIWPGLHQCVCPNEACQVFMWVPWDTAAENLADSHVIELPDLGEGEALNE
jgi:hypothetical protein